ncbi:mevalonate kinase family protein [Blattabacterium cuenoti]|uniref:mevalonate kinase family protein n=1 Tax=Blattabacterium cuenoti TaxID=1653831 RepID=UPI001EEB3B23|nr:mevalonate kinase [Blattabacterium cuenoti]
MLINKNKKLSIFPSKILLFGEYGILKNYTGFSIPNYEYKGYLKFYSKLDKNVINSNNEIRKFFNFLKIKKFNIINLEKLDKDLKKGIYFKSNIPQKYGIGSSGSLVAAIYDRYLMYKTSICNKNLIFIKNIFSNMESFFHGKSSGIDPLICYLKKPILVKSNKHISTININIKMFNNKNKNNGGIFLINSGLQSNTKKMNNLFIKKIKEHNFKKIMDQEYEKYNVKCIYSFINRDYKTLLENIKKLSIWIFNNIKQMIPKNMLKIWINGIKNDNYYLKLCGSGGGGFFLGFTKDYTKLNNEFELNKYIRKIIFYF